MEIKITITADVVSYGNIPSISRELDYMLSRFCNSYLVSINPSIEDIKKGGKNASKNGSSCSSK